MVGSALHSSRSEEWSTPQSFYDKLDDEFRFTLDPCATPENAKCRRYFTKSTDGLLQNWSGEQVFMNPPYGKQIGQWMRKAFEESQRGTLVVALVHARTDTRWWHEWVERKAVVRFVKGRLVFSGKGRAPFPSAIVIYSGSYNNCQ